MEGKFSVSLATIVHKFGLEPIVMPKDPAEIAITVGDLNRPGLYLAVHHDFFDCSRIQLIGNLEYSYLLDLDDEARDASLCRFFKTQPVILLIPVPFLQLNHHINILGIFHAGHAEQCLHIHDANAP